MLISRVIARVASWLGHDKPREFGDARPMAAPGDRPTLGATRKVPARDRSSHSGSEGEGRPAGSLRRRPANAIGKIGKSVLRDRLRDRP
jgi:hypothetical protein